MSHHQRRSELYIATADGVGCLAMEALTLACLASTANSLSFHKQSKISGCYEIIGGREDLQVILSDPLAAAMIKL